jgi:hypothetical protein
MQLMLISLKASVQPLVSTTYGTDRYQREQAVNTAITALKAQNKATREAKEKEIAEEYRNAENAAWNEYAIAAQTAYITYAITYQSTENTYKVAEKNAGDEYISTVVVGWNTYSNKVDELDLLFESAVAQAGNSGFNPADFFNNGVNGNQGNVQLVSGTQSQGKKTPLPNNVTPPSVASPQLDRAIARRNFDKELIRRNVSIPNRELYEIHHTLPVALKELFEKNGIDINDIDNLRAVRKEIHQKISDIQKIWFDDKIAEELISIKKDTQYKNLSSYELNRIARSNVYSNITIEEVKEVLNKKIDAQFGKYMIKTNNWQRTINSIAKKSDELINNITDLTNIANKVRKGLGLKVIEGTGIVLATIEGFIIAKEVTAPSSETKIIFDDMLSIYKICINDVQSYGEVKKEHWMLLSDRTYAYLTAIHMDDKYIGGLVYLFETYGANLP